MGVLADKIKNEFPNLVLETGIGELLPKNSNDEFIFVKKEGVRELLTALRDGKDYKFNVLMDLSAVDYLHWEEKECRFELHYNLYSLEKKHRLFVKVKIKETDPVIDSAVSIWPAADWYEREVWDMFGIRFSGHPNLKRILMYEGFKGHALRKDYRYNQRQPIIGPQN